MEDAEVGGKRGRGVAKKTNNTRRIWTKNEEKVLMVALKELVNNGWKSDNGFRTGYLFKLEDAKLEDAIPYPVLMEVRHHQITSIARVVTFRLR